MQASLERFPPMTIELRLQVLGSLSHGYDHVVGTSGAHDLSLLPDRAVATCAHEF